MEDKYVPDPNSGCWLWLKCVSTTGYGFIHYQKRLRLAHRVMYELHRGPIPHGLCVDHLCRVRSCVNPWHMQLVTRGENVLRGVGPAAKNKAKKTCIRGHLFTKQNTYVTKTGKRVCKTCTGIKAETYYGGNSSKQFCPKGHPYSGDNLMLVKRKNCINRICRTCKREVCRNYSRKRRANGNA